MGGGHTGLCCSEPGAPLFPWQTWHLSVDKKVLLSWVLALRPSGRYLLSVCPLTRWLGHSCDSGTFPRGGCGWADPKWFLSSAKASCWINILLLICCLFLIFTRVWVKLTTYSRSKISDAPKKWQFCSFFMHLKLRGNLRKITWGWEKARRGLDYKIVNKTVLSWGWLWLISNVC